ncbi:MAG: CHAT domain-containing protein [Candidatus Latescibacterota bacterium]|nr:MAG: CHAT domain-containing protein [Candidatus Latescibacterota bacterium]
MIEHLISSDDSTLARYGREVGFLVLNRTRSKIGREVNRLYLEGNANEASILQHYARRIGRVLASEYHYECDERDDNFIDRLSPDTLVALIRLRTEDISILENPDLSAIDKLKRYYELTRSFEELGDQRYAAASRYRVAMLLEAIGNDKEHKRYLHSACSEFSELGYHKMTCQALGVLGSLHQREGRTDSMIVCYEKAKRIAHRSRIAEQAARISSFYAWYYAGHGRLSLAHDLLNEAIEICREYKGGYKEIRFIVEAMKFHANLGCWEIVDRLLRRTRVLEREYPGELTNLFNVQLLRDDQVEARMHMARGNPRAAEEIFRETIAEIENMHLPHSYREEIPTIHLHWAEGLLDNDRPNDALAIAREGLRRCVEISATNLSARFALVLAKASHQLSDIETTAWALQRFDDIVKGDEVRLQREWVARDVLHSRLDLASNDQPSAIHALEEGLARFTEFVTKLDPAAQSYLWIGECDDLRQLMHDLTSHDPLLGYGAELYWRDLYRAIGREHPYGRHADAEERQTRSEQIAKRSGEFGSIFDDFSERALRAKTRVNEIRAIHCTYLLRSDEVWRWTVTPTVVRRDVLGIATNKLRDLVLESWRMMSVDPSDPARGPSPRLSKNLRMLAHVLLPPEVSDETKVFPEATLLISTDGFLSRIPFETFDIGSGEEYEPLLVRRDVAYLRHADPPTDASNAGPGVILASSRPSERLRNRYPFQPELPDVLPEVLLVKAMDPGTTLLSGDSATKSNLRSEWEEASYVYLAAHTLRDPQVPYLMLIPVATPADELAPEAAYLDFADIRAADLRNCETAVLSGCSSGAPYVEARVVGPSLGDAFLDAGTGAVVQTFWDVRDDAARELMKTFTLSWLRGECSTTRALCNARRNALRGPDGVRHPFSWASFSIKISRL